MKLIFDIGNTNVVFAVFRDSNLVGSFRLQSDKNRTVDEYSLEVLSLLLHHHIDRGEIKEVIIGSVVPQLTRVFSKVSAKYFNLSAHVIESSEISGMDLRVEIPASVGIDRVANAFAARELYGAPCIVVDLGTATTFDVVGAGGSYEGGLIAPGLVISAEALFSRAALLQSVELKAPDALIGKNTKDAMLSGILNGYASLIEGLVRRLKSELGESTQVIATGGLATTMAKLTTAITVTNSDLTLTGFRLLAQRSSRKEAV